MKVRLIPEDFTYDQHVLLPLFSRLFRDIGKPNAKISVCRDPNLGGVEEALKVERLREIVNSYRMMDLFILCVDRDGKKGRKMRLDQIENEFGASFLAENAWEEIETWLLAGLELPKEWRWGDVRAELQVKRTYFEPLARKRGVSDRPDGGRGALAREAVRNITAIASERPAGEPPGRGANLPQHRRVPRGHRHRRWRQPCRHSLLRRNVVRDAWGGRPG